MTKGKQPDASFGAGIPEKTIDFSAGADIIQRENEFRKIFS